MGQKLSKKVLQRHISEATKMERILQEVLDDASLRLTVFTGKVDHAPIVAISDFVGWVKYLVIYNPSSVENVVSDRFLDESPNRNDQSQQLKKKVLTCRNFLILRRLCYEYMHVLDIGTRNASAEISAISDEYTGQVKLKAGQKRVDSFDPDECSICMDASIDIVLPCLHGYCSACWDDWSSHNSTCPYCRGEVKDSKGQSSEHVTHDGQEDIWQYESWDEGDMKTQLQKIKVNIMENLMNSPFELTKELMTSHSILSPSSNDGVS